MEVMNSNLDIKMKLNYNITPTCHGHKYVTNESYWKHMILFKRSFYGNHTLYLIVTSVYTMSILITFKAKQEKHSPVCTFEFSACMYYHYIQNGFQWILDNMVCILFKHTYTDIVLNKTFITNTYWLYLLSLGVWTNTHVL